MSPADTIFALSTAAGRAGVAVVRVSGARARVALTDLAGPVPEPRSAVLRAIRRPGDTALIDRGLVIWFPGPGSFTGEDIVEFHVHGGRAVVQAMLAALQEIEGFRLAEPGEFARRAFDNEKLGLTEVEGLADLIDAETEAQRRQALRQATGALEGLYETWRQLLIETLGLAEAAIDFSDEGDVADDAVRQAEGRARELLLQIDAHLNDGRRGEIVRDGLRVVLAGVPNAGKSSLLNRLARREAAIVSPEAGTTRDVIEVVLDLDGFRVVVSDTAGIRESEGLVEREGVRRALALSRQADLLLWLIDAVAPVGNVPDVLAAAGVPIVEVWNKSDLVASEPAGGGRSGSLPGISALSISALSGEGVSELEAVVSDFARRAAGSSEEPVLTQQRHREALGNAADGLRRFLGGQNSDIELRAEDLRMAARALGRLVGRVDVEDVLGQIFARFCIGK